MKQSRTAGPSLVVESPAVRSLPLVEFLVDTKAELFDLTVRWGLQVLGAVLEEDRAALCGPRYAHQPDPAASRAGSVPSEVVPAADLPGAGALGHQPPTTARTETSAFPRRRAGTRPREERLRVVSNDAMQLVGCGVARGCSR